MRTVRIAEETAGKRLLSASRFFIIIFSAGLLFFRGASAVCAAQSADALFNKAVAAYQSQNLTDAAKSFGQAGQAYAKGKNNLKAAQCYYNQGLCQAATDRTEDAAAAFEQSAALYQKAKDTAGECNARFSAAQIHMAAMRWDKARGHFERGLKIAGTPVLRGIAQEGLGRVQREKGNLAEAEKSFRSAEKSFKENLAGRLRVRLQLAYITGLQGNILEALKICDSIVHEAAALQKDEKTRAEGDRIAFLALSERGTLLLRNGWFDDAQETLSKALEAGEALGTPHAREILAAQNNYAQTFMYLGDFDGAEKKLNGLADVAVVTQNSDLTMELVSELGTLARMKGQYERALDSFRDFQARATEGGNLQRLAQAYIQQGDLYMHTGVWGEAAAHYQEALSAALKAQDMDSALTAMQGIYAVDIRNELGIAGRVDYKSMQGLPWRSALTARALKEERVQDAGFFSAWKSVDSLRKEIFAPIPSLDGFRLIREMAFRSAPEIRNYRQEVRTGADIGDAVLRRAVGRLEAARDARNALLELSARKDEAVEKRYVAQAFGRTLDFLRALAGEDMLSVPKEGIFIQISGILLEASAPQEQGENEGKNAVAQSGGPGGTEADLKTLSRMISLLSPKAAETEALQKALIEGRPLPEDMKNRLRRTLFSRAGKAKPSPDELRGTLLQILETTHPSLKKEAGSLASKGGKLYTYALSKLEAQRAALAKDAEALLPQTSAWLLLSLDAGEESLGCLEAWQNTRRRALLLRELGIPLKTAKNWETFLTQLGAAAGKGKNAFEAAFTLAPEDAAPGMTEKIEKLYSLAEMLALSELREEGDNVASLLANEGKVSYDDRLALLELQSRIFHALAEPEKAEAAAQKLLALVTNPTESPEGAAASELEKEKGTGGERSETQPELQWRAYSILAQAAESRKDYAKAEEFYGTALSHIAKIHPVEGTTSQSTSDRIALYDGAIHASFELWRENPSAEAVEKI